MSKANEDKFVSYKFKCPKCNGTGNIVISTKFQEWNLPCDFKLCKGEGIIAIEASSKKKAKEIYGHIAMMISNGQL